MELELDLVRPKAGQPRQVFDEEKLQELAGSIEETGLIVPILVRPVDDHFEIVHGERRWRAHKMLGLETIRSEVAEAGKIDDKRAYVLSVVENEQREDLSPVETAQALKHMISEEKLSQAEVAKRIGRSRTWVAQKLRLLNLSDDVQTELRDGNLSEAHARQILKLKDDRARSSLAQRAATENWSVRRLEAEVNMALLDGQTEEADTSGKVARIAERLEGELTPAELRELVALLAGILDEK